MSLMESLIRPTVRLYSLQVISVQRPKGIEKQFVSVQFDDSLVMIPLEELVDSNLVKTQSENNLFKSTIIGS